MPVLLPLVLAAALAAPGPDPSSVPTASAIPPGDSGAAPLPGAPAPRPESGPPPLPSGVLPPEAPRPLDPTPQTRRYQIERIRFVGLRRTDATEIRRHLLVAEGELLDQEAVLLSRLRLLQLGWFSRVETRVERGSERGLVVLVFDVSERNTLIVTDFILGSTKPEPLYGGLGLSQQNFLGRGLGLSGAFAYGGAPEGRPQDPDRFAARASFFAPNIAAPGVRRGLVVGATAQLVRGDEFACPDPECEQYRSAYGAAPRLRYQRAMAEGTVGIRPGPFERLLASYRYERVHASEPAVVPLGTAGSYVLPGWSNVSALSGTYELDTRDDFFLPRDGMRGLLQVTFGSRLLGGDYEYSRYLLQLESAFDLLRLPLRLQATLGVAQGGAPFFDRFYAADWSYFAVGPAIGRALELNFSTDSRYDAFLAMGGAEYAVPLWSTSGFFTRGYLAVGARAVYSSSTLGENHRTRVSRTPLSADVALRFDTPVGVFNLSAGYLLDNVL